MRHKFPVSLLILGSGTSHGVPMIACDCPVCRSTDPRDKRTRACALVRTPEISLLIDTGPDLREQVLRENIHNVDGVLFTHAHADHVMGFDDLRRYCDKLGGSIPVYGSAETLGNVAKLFHYAFGDAPAGHGYVHAVAHIVEAAFELGGIRITPLEMRHGRLISTGWMIEREGRKLFAYMTDCNDLPLETRQRLHGVEVLIIDGLRDEPHPSHFTIGEAIEVAHKIEARRTVLTHLTHHKTHAQRTCELPEDVEPAYDGWCLTL